MPTERTGTIAATNGSKYLVGTDTAWRTRGVQPGAKLMFATGGLPQMPIYEVEAVTDNTHITLRQAYQGATGTGKAYEILDVAYDKTTAELYDRFINLQHDIEAVLDKGDGSAASGKFAVLGANGKLPVDRLNTNAAGTPLKLDSNALIPEAHLPERAKSSNPNLLHNWDFTNPVNQRGQSVYFSATSGLSAIDRWKTTANMKCEVLSSGGGVRLTAYAAYRTFYQRIEQPGNRLAGKKVTVSLDVAECTGKFAVNMGYGAASATTSGTLINAGETGIKRATITLPPASDMANNLSLRIASSSDPDVSLTLKSVKLETGGSSTLRGGEVADYAEELAKCQRFLLPVPIDARWRVVGIPSSTALQFVIPLPCTARIMPSVEDVSAFSLKSLDLAAQGAQITAIESLRGNTGLLVRVTCSEAHGMTDGLLYANAATYFNAEL